MVEAVAGTPAIGLPGQVEPSAVNTTLPAGHEFELSVPEGGGPGQTLTLEYLGLYYDVVVPDDCGPGSSLWVTFPASCQDEHHHACGEDRFTNLAPEGFHGLRDESACDSDMDSSPEEDPMWSTDWTLNDFPSAGNHATMNFQETLDRCSDCCVQQQPDCFGVEDSVQWTTNDHEDPESGCVQVFGMSDVSTWFTRLQQRREQAIRSGKAKLMRKIDRELDTEVEKARQQGPTGAQAAFCNGEVDEEPPEKDSVWGMDWVGLLAMPGGA